MINIKDIVDSAIQANIADYKKLVVKYNRYREWAECAPVWSDKDDSANDFQQIAWRYSGEFNEIKKTLVRIFPDHEQYINDKLIQVRISLD